MRQERDRHKNALGEVEGCFARLLDVVILSQSSGGCSVDGSNALQVLERKCRVESKSWTEVASCDGHERCAHFVTNFLYEACSLHTRIQRTQITTRRS